jgi:anti-sigma B factor antagonist
VSTTALPSFACSWMPGAPGAALVHVTGDLDIATTPRLERELRERQAQVPLLVLDLRDLSFMDSSGVHAIVRATASARRIGRRLLLLRGPPNIDDVFARTGSTEDVEIGDVDVVDTAVTSLLEHAARARA